MATSRHYGKARLPCRLQQPVSRFSREVLGLLVSFGKSPFPHNLRKLDNPWRHRSRARAKGGRLGVRGWMLEVPFEIVPRRIATSERLTLMLDAIASHGMA